MLIVLDGIHGCGKTTLIKTIYEYYAKYYSVKITEWNSHPIIQPVIYQMKNDGELVDPIIYTMMQFCDFIYRYEDDIKGKSKTEIVIADRYYYTGISRGVSRGINREFMENLYSFIEKPDIYFFIDTPVEESMERSLPQNDSIWKIGMNCLYLDHNVFSKRAYKKYLTKLRNEYLKFNNQENVIVVDGSEEYNKKVALIISEINKKLMQEGNNEITRFNRKK